jgi:hypothetical protein
MVGARGTAAVPVRLSGPELVVDVVDFGDEGVAAGGPLERLMIELFELVAKVVLASGQLGSPRADHSTAQRDEVALGADRRHGGGSWDERGREPPVDRGRPASESAAGGDCCCCTSTL